MSVICTTGVIAAARRRDPLATISGCIFAYESWRSSVLNPSEDPVGDDDSVARIVDLSPAGNDLINEFSNRPLWKENQLNGHGSVRSEAADPARNLYWPSAIPARTVFAVVRQLSDNSLAGLFGNTSDFGLRRNSSTEWRTVLNSANSGDFTYTGELRINGFVSSYQELNTWAILSATTDNTTGINRVFEYFSGRAIEADLAALRIYDRVLDPEEIEAVERFYSQKTDILLGPLSIIPDLDFWSNASGLWETTSRTTASTEGTPVGDWVSNRGRSLSNTNASQRPTLVGGLVAFDNVNDVLISPQSRPDEYTAIARIKLTALRYEGERFFGVNYSFAGALPAPSNWPDSLFSCVNEEVTWDYGVADIPVIDTYCTVRLVRESPTVLKMYANGDLVSSITGSQTTDMLPGIRLMSQSYAGFAYASRVLTDDEVSIVESHFETLDISS